MIILLFCLVINAVLAFFMGRYAKDTYVGYEWSMIFSFCFTPIVAFLVVYASKNKTLIPATFTSCIIGANLALIGLGAIYDGANEILHKSDSFSQTIHNNMFFTTYIETVYAFIFGLGLVAWGSYYSRMPIFRFRNSDLYTMRNEENEKSGISDNAESK